MSILQNPVKIFTELLESNTNVMITQKSIEDILLSAIDLNVLTSLAIKSDITDITVLTNDIINNQLKTSITDLSTNVNYNIILLKNILVENYQEELFGNPSYELSTTLSSTNTNSWLTPYINNQSSDYGIYPIYTTNNLTVDISNNNISTNEFTISFWSKSNRVAWRDLLSFGVPLNNSTFLTKLEYYNNGNLNVYTIPEGSYWIDINNKDGLYIPANKFETNKFQLITLTVKDSILKGYSNGELVMTSQQNTNWPTDTVLTKIIFGGERNVISYFADAKIYNHAFTDEEVHSFYESYINKEYKYFTYTITTPNNYSLTDSRYSVLPSKYLTNTTDYYSLLSNGTIIANNEIITYKIPHPIHYKFNNVTHNGYLCKKANKMFSPKLV